MGQSGFNDVKVQQLYLTETRLTLKTERLHGIDR